MRASRGETTEIRAHVEQQARESDLHVEKAAYSHRRDYVSSETSVFTGCAVSTGHESSNCSSTGSVRI